MNIKLIFYFNKVPLHTAAFPLFDKVSYLWLFIWSRWFLMSPQSHTQCVNELSLQFAFCLCVFLFFLALVYIS